MSQCKADYYNNYHVPDSDVATIAGHDLSISMTRWSSDVSHQGFTKLAKDTGDQQVIDTVAALIVALDAAKAAIQAYVRVRP